MRLSQWQITQHPLDITLQDLPEHDLAACIHTSQSVSLCSSKLHSLHTACLCILLASAYFLPLLLLSQAFIKLSALLPACAVTRQALPPHTVSVTLLFAD